MVLTRIRSRRSLSLLLLVALPLGGCDELALAVDAASLDGGLIDGDAGDEGDGSPDGDLGPEPDGGPPRVTTVAGSGTKGFADGFASAAAFDWPSDVAVGIDGAVYVADTWNNRIRVVHGGLVKTLAGNGVPGFADGAASAAKFNQPEGVAVDGEGRVYVADRINNRIRLIENGFVSTVAGDTAPGQADGAGAVARFNWPAGLALADGGALLVADTGNHGIRRIVDGKVETVAGTGLQGYEDGLFGDASFAAPCRLAVGPAGEIFVGDRDNNRIRVLAISRVKTVAGTGVLGSENGLANLATFNFPCGVAVDGGRVFVADTMGHTIRLIENGRVSTLAGDGSAGFEDGLAGHARFSQPRGMVTAGRRLYIADRDNHRIRVIDY